jgi:hypothetical protein
MLALFSLTDAGAMEATGGVVSLPGFPGPNVRVPVTKLPEMLRS